MVVRTERERDFTMPVAVILGNGVLPFKVTELIVKQGVKVVSVKSVKEMDDSEGAKFALLFLVKNDNNGAFDDIVSDFLGFAARNRARALLVLDGLSEEQIKKINGLIGKSNYRACIVEIRSELKDIEKVNEVALKIVRMVFSSRGDDKLVIGEFGEAKKSTEAIQEIEINTESKVITKKRNRIRENLAWILIFFLILTIPAILGGIFIGLTGKDLYLTKENVDKGNFMEAVVYSRAATEELDVLGRVCGDVIFFKQVDVLCEGLNILEASNNVVLKGLGLQEKATLLMKSFFSPDAEAVDVKSLTHELAIDSGDLAQQLGFLEAGLDKNYDVFRKIFLKLGIDVGFMDNFLTSVREWRYLARVGSGLFPVLPDLIDKGKKTYLIVFQNSSELRASGGFINSYAILHVDGGKLLDFKVNDIYTSDGLMKGKIDPPPEILQYLGQTSWYMRDANVSPDFPLTAKRLTWFLEKETGQKVDGVIGLNSGGFEDILKSIGPVTIQTNNEIIEAGNFSKKAEYAAEIQFIPGTAKKRDFLGEVGEAILTKLSGGGGEFDYKLISGLGKALIHKDLMIYFNKGNVQEALEDAEVAGSIAKDECLAGENCLMVVEDNYGANKANYFVSKEMKINSVIDKAGEITNEVVLEFDNKSPSDSWPGGRYKNYLRFLIPDSSKVLSVDFDPKKTATYSSVLSADVLSNVRDGEFLVYKSNEQLLTTKEASSSGYQSLGMLVEIPSKEKRRVAIKYKLATKLDFMKESDEFKMSILKQPGNAVEKLQVVIGFPVFLTPENKEILYHGNPIVKRQEIIYNTKLDKDKEYMVRFKQN